MPVAVSQPSTVRTFYRCNSSSVRIVHNAHSVRQFARSTEAARIFITTTHLPTQLLTCAMVCSSNTACPHAALISSHSTGTSGVLPNRNPLMVPKGPSCLHGAQIL